MENFDDELRGGVTGTMKSIMVDSANTVKENGGSGAGSGGGVWNGMTKVNVGGGKRKDIMNLRKTTSKGAGEENECVCEQ